MAVNEESETLLIYWADSKKPLTRFERSQLECCFLLVLSISPKEVLIKIPNGRKVVVTGNIMKLLEQTSKK